MRVICEDGGADVARPRNGRANGEQHKRFGGLFIKRIPIGNVCLLKRSGPVNDLYDRQQTWKVY